MISPELSPKLIANQGKVIAYWRDNYLQRTSEYDFALSGLPHYLFMNYKIKLPKATQQTFVDNYIQNATQNGWTVDRITKEKWLDKSVKTFYDKLSNQNKKAFPYEVFREKLSTYWKFVSVQGSGGRYQQSAIEGLNIRFEFEA